MLQPDAGAPTRGYVDQVEPASTLFARLTRWFRGVNPWVIDAVLGSVFTVLGLVSLFGTPDPKHVFTSPDALAVVLALACSTPLFFRRQGSARRASWSW